MTTSPRRITVSVAEELIQNTDPWLSCDDCFALTDRCVEDLVDRARPPSTEMAVHLAACPACKDEVVALVDLVCADEQVDPSAAHALLEASVSRPDR